MCEVPMKQIEAIQSSGYKAAVVVSGGGTGAVHALLAHPGASRFVLEAQVPYSPEAMFDYLGETLEQYCSEAAARTMAGRAFERALIFSISGAERFPILGISCTAALQTTRSRRGADRAYVCIKSREREVMREVDVPAGSRAEQEDAVSRGLLELIAKFVDEEAP